jgi:sodium/hydrogen exchanger-like protein 3
MNLMIAVHDMMTLPQVLYHLFEGLTEIGEDNIIWVDVVYGVLSFFVVVCGGTLIGVIIGLLCALVTRFTDHVRVIEPLVVFVMGYLSYIVAEMFHLSSILSCTFCAITMKKFVEANISQKSHTTIKYFLKMLASVSETIIFMVLGISTVYAAHEWDTGFCLMTLVFCLVYRAFVTVGLTFFANRYRLVKLNAIDQFIISYGGLRGAIAFSLVVLLDEEVFPQARLFLTTCLLVIYFTNFIQGSTIKPLVNLFRVKKADKRKPTMNEQMHSRMMDHLMAGIEDVTGYHGHHNLRMS